MSQSSIFMVIASFLFALMGVCVRFASETVPIPEIVFFRSIIGLVLIIPVMLHQKASFRGKRPAILLIRGVTGFLALSLYFWSISKIPLATAVMLNYTSPLFVSFLAPVILKEPFDRKTFFLILLGLFGVLLIVHPQPHMNLWGALVGLVSGIFAAFAYLSIGAVKKDDSSLTIVFYFFWVASLLAIPAAWSTFKIPNPRESLCLFGTGLFATIAQVFMTRAYRIGNTTTTSAYSSSIVLFSIFCGMIFYREIPNWICIIGGLLVVISVVLIAKSEKTALPGTQP